MSSTPTAGDFDVGVICALQLEAEAVLAVFDESFGEETGLPKGLHCGSVYYSLSLGRIGNRYVAMIWQGDYGTKDATEARVTLQHFNRQISVFFIVGVCGGVPGVGTKTERLMGDVVISTAIFPHDIGKRYDSRFLSTGKLYVPSTGSFLKKQSSADGRKHLECRLLKVLQTAQLKSQEPRRSERKYQGMENDVLFPPDCIHKHNKPCCNLESCEEAQETTCEEVGCDKSRVVDRIRLEKAKKEAIPPDPVIHFGTVASGNVVMKSGRERDDVVERLKKHHIIAFEMEGAGACREGLDVFVVKGICDFADSHKNKCWQDYSAFTAAAAFKAFLEEYPVSEKYSSPTTLKQQFDHVSEKVSSKAKQKLVPLLGDIISHKGNDSQGPKTPGTLTDTTRPPLNSHSSTGPGEHQRPEPVPIQQLQNPAVNAAEGGLLHEGATRQNPPQGHALSQDSFHDMDHSRSLGRSDAFTSQTGMSLGEISTVSRQDRSFNQSTGLTSQSGLSTGSIPTLSRQDRSFSQSTGFSSQSGLSTGSVPTLNRQDTSFSQSTGFSSQSGLSTGSVPTINSASNAPPRRQIPEFVKACLDRKVDDMESVFNSQAIDVNLLDDEGSPMLHLVLGDAVVTRYPAKRDRIMKALGFLCLKGANVNIRGKGGARPIHKCAGTMNKEAAEYLVNKGAKINWSDANGKTALDYLSEDQYPDVDVVIWFIEHGARLGKGRQLPPRRAKPSDSWKKARKYLEKYEKNITWQ